MSEKPFTITYYLIDSFVQNKPLKDPVELLFIQIKSNILISTILNILLNHINL
jgi:hypothetical protein